MSFKLYVENLGFQTSKEDLLELFASVGTVESASVIEDRETGRSRGFGFVEMSTLDEVRAAIVQFDGTPLFGRVLRVNPVRTDSSLIHELEERLVDGPEPIERTLYLDSQPIAVAYLDKPETEATLAWPLMEDASLAALLDCYLNNFLPKQPFRVSNNTLEFWIDDRYYEFSVGFQATSLSVLRKLQNVRWSDPGSLSLLQITSDNVVMELLFDKEKSSETPIRLALLISGVRAEPLVRLFSAFHKNALVRGNLNSRPSGQISEFLKRLLHPLPIYSNSGTLLNATSFPHPLPSY